MRIANQISPVYQVDKMTYGKAHAAMSLSDVCVSASVNSSGEVCIDIPVVGHVCIPIPTPLPPGTSVSACIDVCTHIVPTGACVTVTALGHQVARQCFGWC